MKKFLPLLAWLVMTAATCGYLAYRLRSPDRSVFLPDRTTHGHYQIEMTCSACHTPWMGVKEQSCYDCHGAALKAVNDSHPKSKFTDPRNADRLKSINAADCLTCHREHVPGQTHSLGVTVAGDFCFHCHQETLTQRPSHKNFAFNSCLNAGCHNYHDNSALYEDFLAKHLHESENRTNALVPRRNLLAYLIESGTTKPRPVLTSAQQDAPKTVPAKPAVVHAWETTAHARAGINCTDCHVVENPATHVKAWSDKLDLAGCQKCHADETSGFLAGLHGMRIAQKLSPMTPALARLPMKSSAAHKELNCIACHDAHEFDTRKAAMDSCLTCHNDQHSLAYRQSPHFALWQAETAGQAPAGSGVSCATCHMPREIHKDDGVVRVLVQHNQDANLRPNSKMIRSVCLNCHGLGFTIDALADTALVQNNFRGQPAHHVESLDLVLRRQQEAKDTKKP